MRFGKLKMFFLLHAFIALVVFIYLSPWMFSNTVNGHIVHPLDPIKMTVEYNVNNKVYYDEYLRQGVPFSKSTVDVRYLTFNPQRSRVNSFLGIWAEPLAWWLVLLIATSMLLLTNNGVFSKGTVFQLHKKFPYISMEEYFPVKIKGYRWWHFKQKAKTPKEEFAEAQVMEAEPYMLNN